MPHLPSTQVPLGTVAPDFKLFDPVSEKNFTLNELKSDKATVVFFICNHCPSVKNIIHEVIRTATEFQQQGVSFIAINSNEYEMHPEDSPEKMKEYSLNLRYPFPYLYDETQEVAKSFDAQCTPEFFIYNKDMKLSYHGQFDDSRPSNTFPVTGRDVRLALEAIVEGKPVNPEQKQSVGCGIKWKNN